MRLTPSFERIGCHLFETCRIDKNQEQLGIKYCIETREF